MLNVCRKIVLSGKNCNRREVLQKSLLNNNMNLKIFYSDKKSKGGWVKRKYRSKIKENSLF